MKYFSRSVNCTSNGLRRAALTLCVGTAILCMAAQIPASAQSTRDLANRIERLEQDLRDMQNSPAVLSEGMTPDGAASVQVRVLKLEQLVEQLTGQLEESRYRVGQMSTQLRQLSDDMSLRLATLEQALGVSGAVAVGPNTNAAPTTSVARAPSSSGPVARAPAVIGDAPLSQPVSSQPRRTPQAAPSAQIAAGSPQNVTPDGQMVLRTDEQGIALAADPNAPVAPRVTDAPLPVAPPPTAAPIPGAVSTGQLATLPPANRVALPDGTPKEQYEYAFKFLTRNDFASAEVALRDFLGRHPEDPLAGNAQYWLGETYYVRGDYKQAAVEFMSGYQKYPRSNKGPDNLLKLGMSMASLGQKQGACTALGRIAKDYADAPDQIKRAAASQSAELKC